MEKLPLDCKHIVPLIPNKVLCSMVINDIHVKMPRLSEGTRWQIIALSTRAGWSQNRIAREFDISQSTVSALISKHTTTGNVKDRPRSESPRCTDVDDNGLILDTAENDPFTTAGRIQTALTERVRRRVSTQTIRNRLHAANLRARRPARYP